LVWNKPGQTQEKQVDFDSLPAIIIVEPYGSTYPDLLKKIKEEKKYNLVLCATTSEVIGKVPQMAMPSVVLCASSTEDGLKKNIMMLGALRNAAKINHTRVMMTSSVRQFRLMEMQKMAGFSEIVQEPVSARSISNKLDRHIENLLKHRNLARAKTEIKAESDQSAKQKEYGSGQKPENSPQKEHAYERHYGRAARAQQNAARAEADKPQFLMGPPLKLKSDCWLQEKNIPKKVTGKWIIKMRGPGPAQWKWTELERAANGTQWWQWTPLDISYDKFTKEQGAWLFKGERAPECYEETWWFIDSEPVLGFFNDGQCLGQKIYLNTDKILVVANDSNEAYDNYPLILESYSTVIRQKQSNTTGTDETEIIKGKSVAEKINDEERRIKMQDHLTIDSDCWLVKRRGKCVGGRWTSQLFGPPPVSGRWEKLKDLDNQEAVWELKLTDEHADIFVKEQGSWIFKGLQPVYDEAAWIFTAEKPHLGFFYQGTSYGDRLKCDTDGNLMLARNSPQADAMSNLIKPVGSGGYAFDRDLDEEAEEWQEEKSEFNNKIKPEEKKKTVDPFAKYFDKDPEKDGFKDLRTDEEFLSMEIGDKRGKKQKTGDTVPVVETPKKQKAPLAAPDDHPGGLSPFGSKKNKAESMKADVKPGAQPGDKMAKLLAEHDKKEKKKEKERKADANPGDLNYLKPKKKKKEENAGEKIKAISIKPDKKDKPKTDGAEQTISLKPKKKKEAEPPREMFGSKKPPAPAIPAAPAGKLKPFGEKLAEKKEAVVAVQKNPHKLQCQMRVFLDF